MMFTNLKGSLGHFFSLQACFEVPGGMLPISANIITKRKAEFTFELDQCGSRVFYYLYILERYIAEHQELLQH